MLDNAKDDIGGLNLYAYCDNNPVSGRDDDGNMSFWKKLAIAAAVVVAVAVVAAVVAAATAATGGAAGAALCAVTSTFVGAAKGAVIGAVTGAVSGAVTGAVTGAVEGYQEDGWDGVLSGMGKGAMKGAVQGAQDGLLSGMVMGGIGGAMNPSFCFVAGTAVLTAAGHRAIEDIKIGDLIPCVDHITGERAEKRVVSTTVKKTDTLVDLVIAGETIRTTTTHPFQVKDKGWVHTALCPSTMSDDYRNSIYTEAEILFGRHVRSVNGFDLANLIHNVVVSIFTSLPGISQAMTCIDIYKLLFHSGAVTGELKGAASTFFEEYLNETYNKESYITAKPEEISPHKWTKQLLTVAKNAANAALKEALTATVDMIKNIYEPFNSNDLKIYENVQEQKNYNPNFIIDGLTVTMEDFIECCSK